MSQKNWMSALWVGLLVFGAISSTAIANPPKFSTLETNVALCPEKEPGGPRRCAPQGGFTVIETKSEMSDFRLVVREETGFQMFLEAAACGEVRYQGPVQWRQFNDHPFAVIQTLKCGDLNDATNAKAKKGQTHTMVVVRGLPGFEALHVDFDSTKHKNAARDAVDSADRFLRGAWPKMEEERVAAEALEQSQEKERPFAGPAPDKIVPAADKSPR